MHSGQRLRTLADHLWNTANEEHTTIAAAIVDGSPERAEAAMVEHLAQVRAALAHVLGRPPTGAPSSS